MIRDHVRVLAPTFFEYLLTLPSIPRTEWAGISLRRWQPASDPVILTGLAGSLTPGLPAGTVAIPHRVGLTKDQMRECDPILRLALVTSAADRGFHVVDGDLLTADHLIIGDERAIWAERGFVAADMETGRLPDGIRFATVRVIVDSPDEDLSMNWSTPIAAVLNPALIRQTARLARDAPRCTLRAADIVRGALAQLERA